MKVTRYQSINIANDSVGDLIGRCFIPEILSKLDPFKLSSLLKNSNTELCMAFSISTWFARAKYRSVSGTYESTVRPRLHGRSAFPNRRRIGSCASK